MRRFLLLLVGVMGILGAHAQTYLHTTDTTYTTCGGTYVDRGGTSGDYGNFENNIVTFCPDSIGACIQLDFTSWLTEPFFDYLIVYDGVDDSHPEIGRYSGTISPGTLLASDGCISIRFISDSTDVFDGWEALISCQACPPGPCLPEMGICRDSTCNSDFFDSGGATGNYADNDSLVHHICSDLGNCVQANFTSFDLENGNDTLFIYDGDSIGGTLIGAYTGSVSPGTVISPSGCMTFLFVSNDSINGAGWEADITCRPCQGCLPTMGNCGDTLCSGTFNDPGGAGTATGNDYNINEYFVHTICGDSGRCMQVDFSVFITEQGFDILRIYDGPSITSPLIATLSGDTMPPVYTASDGCLTFEFYSDANVVARGFEAMLSCVQCPCLPVMDNCLDNACFGKFYDPGGLGSNYLPNDSSLHTICSDSGNCVQLSFNQFQLEAGNDTLYVYDGPDEFAPLMGKYTGTNSPGFVTSTTGCLTFQLLTNGSSQAAGWDATIACLNCGGCLPLMNTCLDSVCGGSFYDSGGLTGNYGNNETFVHTLCSPDPNREIQVDFLSFDIQPGFDVFRVYDGATTGAPLIGSYTSTISPGTVTSTNGCLTFEFISNGSVTAPGWEAQLSCVQTGCLPNMGNCLDSTCAGNFYDSNGPGGNYDNDAYLTHTICGDSAGQCIAVNFTAFELEPVVDHLEIFDGPSDGFPSLGVFSGASIPGSLTATHGCLTFRFISDNNVRRDGWEAGLSCSPCAKSVCLPNMTNCTDSICQADFFDDGGKFSHYSNNANLVHTICSDSGNNMQVEFASFALALGGDTLFIYDGDDINATLLGAYTGTNTPPQITGTTTCLTFRFVSDASGTLPGWEATTRCVNSNCLPNMGDCVEQTCSGKYYDSGGPNGDYSPFEDYVHTICPSTPGCLAVTFDSVFIENGWEYLKIYDGPSTSSPLLTYIIFTGNPGTITSTSGCLTFEFHSNDSVQHFGWSSTLSCVPCPGCVNPVAGFTSDTTLLSVDFTDNSSGTGPLSWLWDFGDGNFSTQQNPTHVYPAAGTYIACLMVTDSCGVDTLCDTITVSCPGPYAGFSQTTGTLQVDFTDISVGNSIASWAWDFGDGGTDTVANPTHVYANPGVYTVCLTITDNCGTDMICQPVTVTCPPPLAGFSATSALLNASFTDTSTGTGTLSWQWDFGDGNTSTAQNPTHHYQLEGTYTVCLIVSDTCGSDTVCQPLTIICPAPTASFSASTNLYTAVFTDASTGNSIFNWAWDFGDGNTSTAANPTHTYAANGSYTVCLIVEDSCQRDTSCQVVTIFCPPPAANFSHSTNLLQATFADLSTGNGISGWAWDFGDGNTSTLQNPGHNYAVSGTYTVCLIVQDNCSSDTICRSVTVSCPPPVAGFSASTSLLGATFTDASTGNFISSYAWDFGDGNTSTAINPSHTYAGPGNYTVCLIVQDTCGSDTICQSVLVSCPPPVAAFNSTSTLLDASFTNASTGNFLSGFAWDFGDGNTSTATNPTHTYASAGTYTVCLIANDSCGADTVCNAITINCPAPTAGFTVSSSLRTATFTDVSTGNSLANWQWDFGDGNTSTAQNPVHLYAVGGTYTVCLVINDLCGADTLCQVVTINCPAPVAGFSTSTSLLGASFTDASSGTVITSYAWDFGDGNTSTVQNPSHIYGSPGVYTVCLVVNDTCAADTICQAVTISCPPPTAAYSFSTNLLTATFTSTSTGNFISGYAWDFGDGNTSTAQNPVHNFTVSGSYTVCLIVNDSCAADTICQTVTVLCPNPAPNFSTTTNFLDATFTNTSVVTGSATYMWDFGDGNSSITVNPTHTYAAAGTYLVCLIANDSCASDTLCRNITVNSCPPAVAGFTHTSSFLRANFTDTTSVTGSATYSWTFGDGGTGTGPTPFHDYAAPGTYTVCLSVTDLCGTVTACNSVTITCPPVTAGFSTSTSLYTANFTDISTGTAISGWEWDFGDGNSSTLQNPSHNYAAAGSYVVCLIVTDTCERDTVCQTITITCPAPTASFSSASSLLGATFTDASGGISLQGWQWDFGDGNTSTAQNPSHNYAASGTYTVCLIVTDTCGMDTFCTNVTISCPPPTAAFSSGSSFLTASFTDISTGNSLSNWQWDFGDGGTTTQQNPTHTYAATGTYTVCLIVEDSCGRDTVCQNLTLNCPPPVAGFTATSSLLGANFTDNSTGNFISSWQWDFGDGNTSTQQNPSHIYAATGTYTVCLIVTDTCSADTFCTNITISCPAPSAAFTANTSLLGASFTDISTGNALSLWLWDFGDGTGSFQQNPSHNYAASGTYTVCLTIRDSCGMDTTCQTVTINCPAPTPAFTATSSLLSATFTDGSSGNFLTGWLWDFGDGNTSTAQNPVHAYASAGTYTVCLTVSDSCGQQTTCQPVTINCPPPVAAFTSTSSLLGATFTDASTGNFVTQWQWDFGDGNTATTQNATHIYASPGTYTVCLVVTDSCGMDTTCQSITISCPPPVANWTSSASLLSATFSDASTGNSLTTWAWNFGDGNSSNQQNPVHVYAVSGTYNVCITVGDSCGTATFCDSVTVICPDPAPNFGFTTNIFTATFSDSSTTSPAATYTWFFGDGNMSNAQDPVHIYASAGTYTVCLSITDTCGTDIICKPVVISCPVPVAGFSFSTSLLTATFTDASTGSAGISRMWDFGDGNTSTATNPVHTYGAPGTYTTCLIVSDTCGTDTICQSVAVVCPGPQAMFSISPSFTTITFSDNSIGNLINGWQWDFGDGNTSTAQNPVHSYATSGLYTVCLIISDTCGNDTLCMPIVANCPPLAAGFTQSTTLLTSQFTDISTGTPANWQWDFGDGNSSTLQNPSHTYAVAGSYTVCLITSDSCSADTVCQAVTIVCPDPVASFTFSNSFLNASFTDLSTGNGISGWSWDFGDGGTSLLQNPTHTYGSAGNYTVCLIVTDSCGMDTICQNVTINCPLPTASFTFATTGLAATFTDNSSGTGISAWDWDFGDGNSSAAQMPTHTYLMPGTYTVCLEVMDTCGADTFCTAVQVDTLTFTDAGWEEGKIDVFPNPFAGQLKVAFELRAPSDVEITVMTTAGVRLRPFRFDQIQSETVMLDLSELSDGMYYIEILVGDKRKLEKVQLIR